MWKGREKIQKFECLENEKRFLDEIKKIFIVFEGKIVDTSFRQTRVLEQILLGQAGFLEQTLLGRAALFKLALLGRASLLGLTLLGQKGLQTGLRTGLFGQTGLLRLTLLQL